MASKEIEDWVVSIVDEAALATGVNLDHISEDRFNSIIEIILNKCPCPFGEFVARKGGLTIFTDSRLRPEETQEIVELLSYCEIRLAYLDLNPKLEKTTFGKLKLGQEFYYNREYNPNPMTKIFVNKGDYQGYWGEQSDKLICLAENAPVEIFKGT